jgi:sugar phosphate isomerase/epimerase
MLMDLIGRLAASSVTFRDEPLEAALGRLRGSGFTRLDLVGIRHYSDHFDPLLVDVGEEECARIRDLVSAYQMQAVSITTYPDNPLASHLNGDDWVEGVDAYVRLGLFLQARHLIFPPGSPAPAADRWRGTAEHAKPWLHEAAQRALNAGMLPAIALQSDSLLRTAEDGVNFLRLLDMMNVGLAVDPVHLLAMGEDPVAALRRMGHAVSFVVLRDTNGVSFNLPPGLGQLDYPAILGVLDEIEYDGPLVLAIDDVTLPADQRVDLLKQGWEYLERITRRKAA